MSGGKGTRLYPMTKRIPKALIKIKNKSIIEIIIDKFLDEGFNTFIVCLGYKSNLIINFQKKYPKLNIKFVLESNH